MKKLFILLFFIFISFVSTVSIKANTITTESASKNLMNPLELSNDNGYLDYNSLIKIKPNSNYRLTLDIKGIVVPKSNPVEFYIATYDSHENELETILGRWFKVDLDVLGSALTTGDEAYYLGFVTNFNVEVTDITKTDAMLCEFYGGSKGDLFQEYRGHIDYIDSSSYSLYDSTQTYYVVCNSTSPITIEQLKSLVLVKDIHNLNTIDSLEIESEYDTTNGPGEYQVTFKATDGVNPVSMNVILLVVDTTCPTVTPKVPYVELGISTVNQVTLFQIFADAFNVSEEYSITVANTDVFKKLCTPGTYSVKYNVYDDSDNLTETTLEVRIIDDMSPEFYLSKFILDSNGFDAMSDEDIKNHIASYLKSNGISYKDIRVLDNEYLDNVGIAGDYYVLYSYYNNDKLTYDKLVLNVHEKVIEEVKESFPLELIVSISVTSVVLIIALVIVIRRRKKAII